MRKEEFGKRMMITAAASASLKFRSDEEINDVCSHSESSFVEFVPVLIYELEELGPNTLFIIFEADGTTN